MSFPTAPEEAGASGVTLGENGASTGSESIGISCAAGVMLTSWLHPLFHSTPLTPHG